MFKVTKKQFMSFVVAVVMLSSTIGFLTSSSLSNNSPPSGNTPNVPDTPVPNQTQTTLVYGASNVQATVQELFPTAVLIGVSNADDTSKVITDLQAIDGVVSVSGAQFVEVQPGRTENFRAELRVTEPSKIADVSAAITDLAILENISIFPQALVGLPDSVEFTNPTLDDTLNHTFTTPQTQAYVLTETRVGDQVLVSLQGQFQGNTLVDLLAFEEANLTSSPNNYFFDAEFEISSMGEDFFVRTSASQTYSQFEKLEKVRDIISQSYENTIIVEPVSTDITINFENSESVIEEDLNFFFSSFEGVDRFDMLLDNGVAFVGFGDVEYESFLASLESELNALGFTVESIDEPVISFQGNVSPDSREEFLAAIETIQTENDVELDVLQEATIEIETIFIPDLNTSLPLQGGSFSAFISPSRTAGETVQLSLFVSASERNGIEQVEAQELLELTN